MSGYVENGPTLVHVGGSLGMIHSESLLDGKWCKVSRCVVRWDYVRTISKIYDFDCSAKLVDHQVVVVYAGCTSAARRLVQPFKRVWEGLT